MNMFVCKKHLRECLCIPVRERTVDCLILSPQQLGKKNIQDCQNFIHAAKWIAEKIKMKVIHILKEKYMCLSRTTFLTLDGNAHSPDAGSVAAGWQLSCESLSRTCHPEVMPPVEARLSRMTGLWRPRPGLLSGDFQLQSMLWGQLKISLQGASVAFLPLPPVGPPSPRPAPRPSPTSSPGCWQSTFHTPACSAGFAPRALRRAHVPASGACSSTRPVFGAQLFWKVVLAYFVQHFYLFMVERGICVSSVRQVSRNKSVLKFLNLLRFSISIAFSLFAASSRSILKLQIFTTFTPFLLWGGSPLCLLSPFINLSVVVILFHNIFLFLLMLIFYFIIPLLNFHFQVWVLHLCLDFSSSLFLFIVFFIGQIFYLLFQIWPISSNSYCFTFHFYWHCILLLHFL